MLAAGDSFVLPLEPFSCAADIKFFGAKSFIQKAICQQMIIFLSLSIRGQSGQLSVGHTLFLSESFQTFRDISVRGIIDFDYSGKGGRFVTCSHYHHS